MNKLRLVSSKYHPHFDSPGQWLAYVVQARGGKPIPILEAALHLYETQDDPLLVTGVSVADILLSLGLDNETLAAAIVFPALQSHELHIDTVADVLGESTSKLLRDFLQIHSLGKIQQAGKRGQHHVENLRKMLLAMVTDVRAVFVVLAERLSQLREAKTVDQTQQQQLAQETMDVYAPLANRLGIWQLKWETEDLCLRYLQPAVYSQIAKELAQRRSDREAYVKRMISLLHTMLDESKIKHYQVSGRVKHIYSIYAKMQRKNASLEQIYDITALRVMVPTIDDCYGVLSVLQSTWQHVQKEFDDYISKPKPNGYRSIHTVIRGPDERFVEVQIRTYQMHEESELGVAAHWRYKEGVLQPSSYEEKIALLRQVMAWQQEVVNAGETKDDQPAPDLFEDQIYVFTPMGDIIDLPKGSTPLDFAYHVHSEVGHRCRGAKVNGHMVPLTYPLQTGARIEILTAKQAHPSRDWLNVHAGYLKTARARAKVAHWFRIHDHPQALEAQEKPEKPRRQKPIAPKAAEIHAEKAPVTLPPIQILGINDLLTSIARCCRPKPGDPVVGYVTRARGVSIHHESCKNLQYITRGKTERLISVRWQK